MIKRKIKFSSPGEILKYEFLLPNGISQKKLADHIGCDVKVINRIVNERTILTTNMAVKLACAFNTSPEFWLNAQMAVELHKVQGKQKKNRLLS